MPMWKYLFTFVLLCGICPNLVQANQGWAQVASSEGTAAYLCLGTALPLLMDSSDGGHDTAHIADALLTTVLVSEGIKRTVRETRPDGSDKKSFPSMHTAAAFAVATMQSEYHPDQAVYWYLGASLIGASRVKLHRHYVHDVLAGAALGYALAKTSLHQSRGLVFSPVLPENNTAHMYDLTDTSILEKPPFTVAPLISPKGYGMAVQFSF